MVSLGGLQSLSKGEISVDQKMMRCVQSSYSKYETALKKKGEEGRKEKEKENELKRKKGRIAELQAKKAKIIDDQKKAMLDVQMELHELDANKK